MKKMKKCILSLWLCCMAFVQGQAQQITGKVMDENNSPMEFVNVVLLTAEDSTFVKGAVTKADGSFVIDTECKGGILRASFVGYQTAFKTCSGANVGIIQMQLEARTMDEVVVKGRLPQYKMTGEGMMTTVANTTLSKLGTADDVLAHVPGLIKKSGAYEVFGKGSPIFYINGRLMRDKTELDRLKAEDILSIEVIRNPGVKYNATVTAVVKIKTRRRAGEGFGFDLRSSYYQSENIDLIEQANFNYRHKGLDVFGSFYYSNIKGFYKGITTTDVAADTLWHQQFSQNYQYKNLSYTPTIGSNFQLNDSNSIGFRYQLSLSPNKNYWTPLIFDITANGEFYDHLTNNVDYCYIYKPSHNLNLYYNGKFGKVNLNLNVDYMRNGQEENAVYNEKSTTHQDRTVTSLNSARNSLGAFKLDVSFPLLGGELSVGAEGSKTNRTDTYYNAEGYVPSANSELRERHWANFIQYSRITPIGQLMAGLRYEHVKFDYFKDGAHMDEQSRSFGNLFPQLSLATQLGKVQLLLAYAGKTVRPNYSQLSTNVTYGNRFLLQTGNPYLKHEYVHNLSLSGMWKILQFSIDYTDYRNAILYWAEQKEDNPSISIVTHRNVPTLKNLALSLVVAPKIGIWSPQLSVALMKQWLTFDTKTNHYTMNKPYFQLSFDNTFNFGHGWVATAGMWLRTKGDMENSYLPNNLMSVDATLTKSFFNDRFSVMLRGSDLFHTQRAENLIYLNQMRVLQSQTSDTREVSVTLRYKFNTTRSKYKGTGAGNAEKNRL